MWVPSTDDVFFSGGRTVGRPVSKINLHDLATTQTGLINFIIIPLGDDVQINNGGTLFRGDLLLVTTGSGRFPRIHPVSRAIFFTDTTYGFLNGFRPPPLIPNQVYRFDADTGEVRVVADGFTQPNGVAFSPDGETAYIADSGETEGVLNGNDQTKPATIYAFDVRPETQVFGNRRVFAYIDSGVPDGLTLDTNGNLYVGCGDGTEVFDPNGTLLGKVSLGVGSANMVFAGKGRLIIMADTKIYLATIAAEG
ncbi:hypothetical protein B0H10DRAFT_2220666 [Mycena sp. CBHHK59/15]|nr:hypothetical protein B0H10DRAFT_2220666 [Mycena sp. CBHHK59/15]